MHEDIVVAFTDSLTNKKTGTLPLTEVEFFALDTLQWLDKRLAASVLNSTFHAPLAVRLSLLASARDYRPDAWSHEADDGFSLLEKVTQYDHHCRKRDMDNEDFRYANLKPTDPDPIPPHRNVSIPLSFASSPVDIETLTLALRMIAGSLFHASPSPRPSNNTPAPPSPNERDVFETLKAMGIQKPQIAQAVLFSNPEIRPSDLAEMLDVSKGTLYSQTGGWHVVRQTLKAREGRPTRPSGSRSTGRIEADAEAREFHPTGDDFN